MKRSIFASLAAVGVMVLASCSVNYDVYYNSEGLGAGEYQSISPGMKPSMSEALDLNAAVKRHQASGYVVIGTMQLNGRHADMGDIIDFAAEKGASVVLYSSTRTGTIKETYVVPVTSMSTTHHSGTVHRNSFGDSYNFSGSVRNTNPYGDSYNFSGTVRNTNPFGTTYNYSGTSTTTTTEFQERSFHIGSYDQYFVFLAKKA